MTTIVLPNGRTAVMLVPEDSKELAIVPLHVIQRLSKLLPTAHPKQIIRDLIDELSARDSSVNQAVEICESFVDFHRTVNLIAEYVPAPLPAPMDEEPADLMH